MSDAFGKGGIADQAMRFNGYPSLEKEDPTIHVLGPLLAIFVRAVTDEEQYRK